MSEGSIIHLKAAGVLLLILLGAFALNRLDYSWASWKPATCMPDHCFCEAIRPGTIAQPANTWSSFGFVWVGLMIINFRRSKPAIALSSYSAVDLRSKNCDRRFTNEVSRSEIVNRKSDIANRKSSIISEILMFMENLTQLSRDPIIHPSISSWLYGTALILVGLGSAFYHASLTLVGQFCDVMGMYLLASFILMSHFSKIFPWLRRAFVVIYPLLNLLLASMLIYLPQWRRHLFAILILVAVVPVYLVRKTRCAQKSARFLLAALATLVGAFFVWMLDINKILCRPESWLQGHALWHLLCAFAAGLWYWHYRSETLSTGT
jgi:hypothetical protein